jgi:hypothetical protein
MIMNGEYGRMWMDVVVVYFKVIFQHKTTNTSVTIVSNPDEIIRLSAEKKSRNLPLYRSGRHLVGQ